MTTGRPKGKVLVVDDEARIREILAAVLRDEEYEVETASNAAEGLGKVERFDPHVLIADLQMPHVDGIELVVRAKERSPWLVPIILTAHGTIQTAVQAIKQGAYDYLTKPFDNDQLVLVVRRAMELHRISSEIERLQGELYKKFSAASLLGESFVMQETRRQIRKIAATNATVLIQGESGTGKELAARAIHYESARRQGPLVIVDCAAIPPSLIESEFFGHEQGAFTDAQQQRKGKFEEANSGTIFLDEIGELPQEAQVKLLRVLQEKVFTRVGGNKPIDADTRIIAATNRDLESMVRDGRFREDLYYRLHVLKLSMPPLREHKEDIPLYIAHVLGKLRGERRPSLDPEALRVLHEQKWKGNVRELENVLQRALLSAGGSSSIGIGNLEFLTTRNTAEPQYDPLAGMEQYIRSLVEQAERQIILDTLRQTHWNRTETAERLKVSRKTLFNKMHQYGIDEGTRRPEE